MSTYGRRREAIADLEQQINDVFTNHSEGHLNDADTPVIPAHALSEVIAELSRRSGVEVLDQSEEQQVAAFVQDNPDLEITPEVLLGFVTMATAKEDKGRPGASHDSSPEIRQDKSARDDERPRDHDEGMHSRSSSRESTGASVVRSEPRAPDSRSHESPFDAKSQRRSAPLSGPPSRWIKRPSPAHRRKSDAGSRGSVSDTESSSLSIRSDPRIRGPSAPVSPNMRSLGSPQMDKVGLGNDKISPPLERNGEDSSGSSSSRVEAMEERISSLPMPFGSDSDSDGDEDETHRLSTSLNMGHDRILASSKASIAPHDRAEALQKTNQELGRKLFDTEKTLQNRLADHEAEVEEMQSKMDEMKNELVATKREEKELRAKERQNIQQIASLEFELAKIFKTLDSSRVLYQNLQKQYADQCVESEKYRTSLRRKEQETKDLAESSQLHQIEVQQWEQKREALEAAHLVTEQELAIARHAQTELETKRTENLMLKVTIDRVRFDLDEVNGLCSTFM